MTEEVPFEGEKPTADLVSNYVPFIPPMVKMITYSNTRPPLLAPKDGGGEGSVYEVDKMPFSFVPYLTFKEIGGEWAVETPLAMCHYVKPTQENTYNIEACSAAAITNAKREQHNKFIIDTLRVFMKRNDCGTSAGLITLPPPPVDPMTTRTEAIKKLMTDKLDTAKRSIEYCALHGYYCGKDYEFDKALEKANDICFEETIKARTGEGKRVRVRLEGRRPTWWDGVSAKDASGKAVMWKRGEGHTFLTPNVLVVEAPCMDLQVQAVSESASEAQPVKNPFDDLFPKPAGPLLTAPPVVVDDDVIKTKVMIMDDADEKPFIPESF